MTKIESETIRRVVQLLQRFLPEYEPRMVPSTTRSSPVFRFAKEYLAPDTSDELSCHDLWRFFSEIVAAGDLPPMPKTAFFRELPAIMESVFGVKRSHSIKRAGKTVRGYKGVTIRDDDVSSHADVETASFKFLQQY
jgi:hypothetical protein